MLVQELGRGERKKGTILHRHPSPMLSPSTALEEKRLRPEKSAQGNCKLALCAFAQGLTKDKIKIKVLIAENLSLFCSFLLMSGIN